MEETKEFDTAMDKVARVYATAPDVVAAVALNFIHARFSARNWVDATTENWPPRKASTRWGATPRNKGRALLVDTGKLIRSFRKEEANTERVVIATDDPKARVHNEGFKGDVVQHVRPHTRVRRGRKGKCTGIHPHHTSEYTAPPFHRAKPGIERADKKRNNSHVYQST